ncbi:phage tail protein [Neisseria polysaccharea]|uniref:phage tail protein n=1 Tax=Neisseria polysaccharea TaxID=489 RepID=UPI003FD7CEF0
MRNDGDLRYDGKRLLNVDDLAGMIPSGAVMYFAGQTAPTGWLKANGAAVSRTNYAALFAAIGTTYGTGDGRTTFNLPDLRGEFVRGWDDGRGIDSGRALGSAQGDAIRNITGKIDSGKNGALQLFDYIEPTGAFGVEKSWKQWTSEGNGGNDNIPRAITFDASRVVPTANENRPRNIALLACIKI